MSIGKQNINAKIDFPDLDRFIKIYPKLLSKYKKEHIDNSEKRFIELSIEHYKTYGDEYINKEDLIFHKFAIEKLYTSRLAIVEYLEEKLKSFPSYKTSSNNNINNNNMNLETDLSDTNAVQKIIYLNELGILDLLKKQPCFATSVNNLATLISAITGEKQTTIQPYLNVLINKTGNENNNPYKTTKTVEKVKNQLINLGIQPK